jgi:NAD(P)-dependent dehydrogenase (short-subunit alcohol dehydrogenase family)
MRATHPPSSGKDNALIMTATVLITGGARRVGAALSRVVAAAGYFVVIHYQSSGDAAEALAREIRAAGGACGLVRADLRDRSEIAGLVPRCIEAFGPLQVLVNNASSYRYDGIARLSLESWDENLRTNLEAPLFLASAFAVAGGGLIVNMLDFKVTSLNPDFFSYTVAKVGMSGATRMMAMAFGGRVRVNGIAPGLTMRSGKQTEEQFQRAWHMTPLGHGPTAEELGAALLFLIRTKSVNGQVISLDGGAALRPRARDISVDPTALGSA